MSIEETLSEDLQRLAEGVDAGGLSQAGIRLRVHERSRRRRRRRAMASGGLVVVAATMLGALGLADGGDGGRRVVTGPAAPTSTSTVGTDGARPTLVAPTVLPPGLRFIEGGSDGGVAQGGGTVTLSGAGASEPVRLTWWPLTFRGGCEALVATGPSPATDPRASRAAAIRAYLDGSANQIGWCEPDGPVMAVLVGPSVSRQQLADLAMTVSRVPGPAPELTLVPPAGFSMIRDVAPVNRSVLMFGIPGAAWPTLRIQVESPGPKALERARSERGGQLATIAGRPALIGPGGIQLLYDDHTLVSISGTAVSEQDVRRAAESLGPTDPGMAPPATPDRRDGRCDRLGLCR